jgi:ectoine hydroxylase-related dioxygenase (phytanoyl-CoA dioxygenase family)
LSHWVRVPGSHKWLKQIAYPEHDIDPPDAISPLLKAGDALIFCAPDHDILCTIASFGR